MYTVYHISLPDNMLPTSSTSLLKLHKPNVLPLGFRLYPFAGVVPLGLVKSTQIRLMICSAQI